jgi:hypothetical protein
MRMLGVLATWLPYRRFIAATRSPEQAQMRVWNEVRAVLTRAKHWAPTLAARGGADARLSDFPLSDYEDYRASLDAAFADPSSPISPLSGEPVVFWGSTSGSTGLAKRFPITKRYFRRARATTPPQVASLFQRFPALGRHPVLHLVGFNPTEHSAAGIEVGLGSNYLFRTMPRPLRASYAFPPNVFRDAPTFLRWAPYYALGTDCSAIFAVTPLRILYLYRDLRAHFGDALPYLEGREKPPDGFPVIRVSPERVRSVGALLDKARPTLLELWPGLQFICTWIGSTAGLRVAELKELVGGPLPIVDSTYTATEGCVTVCLWNDRLGGPAHPGAHVFEFLRVGDEPRPGNLLPLWGLEAGVDYELVISSTMGIVRYRIGDVVRCEGHFNESPVLTFSHKTSAGLALGGVTLNDAEVIRAVAPALGSEPRRWIVVPRDDGKGFVVCLHERSPGAAVVQQVVARSAEIDRRLMAESESYARARGEGSFDRVAVMPCPEDHPVWQAGAEGPHAQSKPVLLVQYPVSLGPTTENAG